MKSKKGFTLIELLVVIAIIALLLAILLPSLGTAKAIAKRVVCSTNLKGSGTGYYVYCSSNDDKLPMSLYGMPKSNGREPLYSSILETPYRAFRILEVDINASPETSYSERVLKWTSDAGGWRLTGTTRMWGAGNLYDSGIIENPKSFYCPGIPRSNGNKAYLYETYSNGSSWPWYNQSPTMTNPIVKKNILSAYYYLPQSSRAKWPLIADGLSIEVPLAALKYTDLKRNSVLGVDMMVSGSFAHKIGNKKGVNALFADGSVIYSHDREIFGHDVWTVDSDRDGIADQNVNSMPGVFRAVIKGIEGNTSYMNQISY